MTMPTDNRATAERIAPFTLADADRYTKRNSTTFEQDIVDAVNEDRKHRDRTVERDDITDERMRAAWDEAYRRVNPPAPKAEWPAYHPASIAWHREFIAAFHGLAAEFDAGMAHRDRTAEREAASKALGYIYGQFAARPVVDKDVALAVVLHALQSKEGYLAAEFDAGERVTEPKAAPVLTWHDDGFRKQVLADETGRIVGSVDDGNAYLSDRGHIGRYVTPQQARDAVKRLAEQRGAER